MVDFYIKGNSGDLARVIATGAIAKITGMARERCINGNTWIKLEGYQEEFLMEELEWMPICK